MGFYQLSFPLTPNITLSNTMKLKNYYLACLLAMTTAPISAATPSEVELAHHVIERFSPNIFRIEVETKVQPEVIEAPDALREALNSGAFADAAESDEQIVNALSIDESGIFAVPYAPMNPAAFTPNFRVDVGPIEIKIAVHSSVKAMRVLTNDGESFDADFLHLDQATGIALIKVKDANGRSFPSMPLRDTAPAPEDFSRVLKMGAFTTADYAYQPLVRIARLGQARPGSQEDLHELWGTPGSDGALFDLAGTFIGLSVVPLSPEALARGEISIDSYLLTDTALKKILDDAKNK